MSNKELRRTVPELLAPAGGPEPFYAALVAGADAIYCALGNDFNARRSAHNFDEESFEQACRAAHLAGTRVYVTENVVVRTEEMPAALDLVRRAWCLGADAFIIQDLGLMAEIRRRWPQIEVHVSTQANVHDARAVALLRDELGVHRVTLSRELTSQELARIGQEGVQTEGFGHGALCFCYSGICMLSSLSGGRSANRGLCAQPCRLPYELVAEDGACISGPDRGRPLCPKDYCTLDDLEELAEAGLGSLKVEGRMKAPDYVWAVVSTYRAALDDLACGRTPREEVRAQRMTRLRRAFNRDFTDAYLHGTSGDEMMSYERSNNRGELVGSVVSSRDLGRVKKMRGGSRGGRERFRTFSEAEVTVRLDLPVGKGDLLEMRPIVDPSQFLTAHASRDCQAGETLVCKTTRPMAAGSPVRVIRSQAALDEAGRLASGGVVRKRPVLVRVAAQVGEALVVELACVDGGASVRVAGPVVEAARTKALSREDLVEHVGRMGGSPFEAVAFDVDLGPGCGMAFSAVHKVRQQATDLLEQELLAPYEGRQEATVRTPASRAISKELALVRDRAGLGRPGTGGFSGQEGGPGSGGAGSEVEVCALVATPQMAEVARAAGATRLYASSDALGAMGGEAWPEGVVALLDEVCRQGDHVRLDPWVVADGPLAVGNLSELALARSRGALPEVRGCIPVHNESCLVQLEAWGAAGIWLSPELSLDEICALAPMASVPVGLVVYGRTRAMTSEHCILQVADRCVHDCAVCKLRQRKLCLRSKDGDLLPVRTDLQGRSRIYAAEPLDATPQADRLIASGVTRLGVDCSLMDEEEARMAVSRVAAAVRAVSEGRRPAPRQAGTSSGHLFSPIA